MKHILALDISVLLGLRPGTVAAQCQPARVYSDAGSIFIERAGKTSKPTASEMDVDPVLSRVVLLSFTRDKAAAAAVGITSPTNSAPLRRGRTNCGALIWTAAMTGSC